GLLGPTIKNRYPTQIIIVGVQALSRFVAGSLDFSPLQLGRNSAYHVHRDPVLQIEDVIERTVKTIRPEMRSRKSINKLPRDTHPVRRFAHAAFKHISNTKFAPNLLHIHRSALVSKSRITGDHE